MGFNHHYQPTFSLGDLFALKNWDTGVILLYLNIDTLVSTSLNQHRGVVIFWHLNNDMWVPTTKQY